MKTSLKDKVSFDTYQIKVNDVQSDATNKIMS